MKPLDQSPEGGPALLDVIRNRRTARAFTGKPIPDTIIAELIDLASHAPSAHHRSPWRFVVVRPGQARTRLATAMARSFRRRLRADGMPEHRIELEVGRSRERIEGAPGLVIVCLDRSAIAPAPTANRARAERVMAIQGVAVAAGTFLLGCEAMGFAAGWFSAPLFATSAVRRAIDIPSTWQPQAMILFGTRADTPPPRRLLRVEEITLWR